ncbi:MAG: hypothetical protein JST86_11955 [Bacteroidetes bacterium]|nr:hypothetical protein [Bacteroidota bacterium]
MHHPIIQHGYSWRNTILLSVVILISCGGTIGNIQKYEFYNIDSGILENAISRVYKNHPDLIKKDSALYGKNEGNSFYFSLNYVSDTIIFLCNVIDYPSIKGKEVDLSLTSAARKDEIMKMATNMNFFEKKRYRKLFEDFVLPKIKNEIEIISKYQSN